MKNISLLLFLIITIALIVVCCTETSENRENKIPNPAAVYCTELGYEYKIVDREKGQVGYCIFNSDKCDVWSFFAGKCGRKWTYCEKHGGKIKTTAENCSFSQECAICILPDGTECYEWDYFKGRCP